MDGRASFVAASDLPELACAFVGLLVPWVGDSITMIQFESRERFRPAVIETV